MPATKTKTNNGSTSENRLKKKNTAEVKRASKTITDKTSLPANKKTAKNNKTQSTSTPKKDHPKKVLAKKNDQADAVSKKTISKKTNANKASKSTTPPKETKKKSRLSTASNNTSGQKIKPVKSVDSSKKTTSKKTAKAKTPTKKKWLIHKIPKTVSAKNPEFPTTTWGSDSIVSFEATEHLPPPELTSISLGFVFHKDQLLLANVPGRGWEIVGGRIDIGEAPEETFIREAMNQVGVTLSHIKMIGVVRIEHSGPEPPNCPYPYPIGHGVQYIGIVDEFMPFSGTKDSLGRSSISPDGFKEHYFEWNEYAEAVFRYAYSVYTKWRKKLKL